MAHSYLLHMSRQISVDWGDHGCVLPYTGIFNINLWLLIQWDIWKNIDGIGNLRFILCGSEEKQIVSSENVLQANQARLTQREGNIESTC